MLVLFLCALSSCSSVFYYPDRQFHSRPEFLSGNYEELQFLSLDQKTKLVAWHLKPKGKSKGVIVQFHGNAENLSSHVLSLSWLINEGYEIFAWDYRGYGGSYGDPDQKSVIEDGVAALNLAWSRKPAGKFIVVGQSLGGAISIRAVDQFEHKASVDLLVLDSTFASYRTVARQTLSHLWWTWPFQWVGWLIVSNAGDAKDALRAYHQQALVIHDESDPVVSISSGRDVFDLLPGPKDFWTFNEGHHLGVFDPHHFERRKQFLKYLDGGKL